MCGLTEATNIDGKVLPLEADDNGPDKSSDGKGGGYVAPPPAKPFADLDPKDYGCLSKAGQRSFCFPPGRYGPQSGAGLELKDMDTLRLPQGWSLVTHYEPQQSGHRAKDDDGMRGTTYNQNYDPPSGPVGIPLNREMLYIGENNKNHGSFEFTAPNDDNHLVCCMFMDPNFGGNVLCSGEGGGDVHPAFKDKAQSISCHPGAQAWVYQDHYGDTGGQPIKGDVLNLKDVAYGEKDFKQNIKAWWISKVM